MHFIMHMEVPCSIAPLEIPLYLRFVVNVQMMCQQSRLPCHFSSRLVSSAPQLLQVPLQLPQQILQVLGLSRAKLVASVPILQGTCW